MSAREFHNLLAFFSAGRSGQPYPVPLRYILPDLRQPVRRAYSEGKALTQAEKFREGLMSANVKRY
jgi:hypothetical protein